MSLEKLKRYSKLDYLEQEPFKDVYLAKDRDQYNKECIVIEFKCTEVQRAEQIKRDFEADIAHIQNCKHPRIQEIKDFFSCEDGKLVIVQDYVKGYSGEELLQQYTRLNEYEAIQLINEVLPLLSYLHSDNIIHKNISLNSIVLRESDQKPVLLDFGIIQSIEHRVSEKTIEDKPWNQISTDSIDSTQQDLRDLAVVTMRLLTGKTDDELYDRQSKTWRWAQSTIISDQRKDVLDRILSYDPKRRLSSAEEILQAFNTYLIERNIPPSIQRSLWYLCLAAVTSTALPFLPGFTKSLINFNSTTPTPTSSVTPSQSKTSSDCPQDRRVLAIACGANLFDSDSRDFDQGKLTIEITENGTSNDRLEIYNQGAISIDENSNLTYGETIIGSFTGGIGATPLEVTFNSNANSTVITNLLNNVTYKNVGITPVTETRTIEFEISDGDGKTSQVETLFIEVDTVNQKPTIVVPEDKIIDEEDTITINGISINDTDNGGEIITVELIAKGGQLTVRDNVANGLKFRNIDYQTERNRIVIIGTIKEINNTFSANRAITYKANANFNGAGYLTINVNDGGKNRKRDSNGLVWPPGALEPKADSKRINITVDPVNDPPRLNIPGSYKPITQQQAVNLIKSWLVAKKDVFCPPSSIKGPPFNIPSIYKYTTGVYLSSTQESVEYLRDNNECYKYGVPRVEPRNGQFSLQDHRATIDVRVTENWLFIDRRGRQRNSSTGQYRFTLKLDKGSWKIADSENLN